MKLLSLSLALLSLSVTARSETLNEVFDEFRKEVRLELRSALDKENPETTERLMRLESLLVEGLPAGAVENVNAQTALTALSQIRVMTKSPKVEALGQKLFDEFRSIKERKDKEFAAAYTAAVQNGAETMVKATKASELDAPLAALNRLQREATRLAQSDESGNRLKGIDFEQGQALTQVLALWQDAMLAGTKLNPNRGGEELAGNLVNYSAQLHDLVPRSVLMERARELRTSASAGPKKPTSADVDLRMREIIREIKTLEDLTPAIAKTEAIIAQLQESGGSSNYYNIGQAQGILRTFRKNYEELKAGQSVVLTFPTPTSNTGGQAYPGPDDLAVLRGMLAKFAIPRILGVKEDRLPTEAESPAAYLLRLTDLARAEKDWPLLGRVLDTAQSLNIAVVATANDANALRLMLAAINQERAKQASGAVTSYLAALRSGSQAIPAEWIGEKLEAIRKASPEAFERGEQRSYSPDANVPPPRAGTPIRASESLHVPAQPKPAAPAASPAAEPAKAP